MLSIFLSWRAQPQKAIRGNCILFQHFQDDGKCACTAWAMWTLRSYYKWTGIRYVYSKSSDQTVWFRLYGACDKTDIQMVASRPRISWPQHIVNNIISQSTSSVLWYYFVRYNSVLSWTHGKIAQIQLHNKLLKVQIPSFSLPFQCYEQCIYLKYLIFSLSKSRNTTT